MLDSVFCGFAFDNCLALSSLTGVGKWLENFCVDMLISSDMVLHMIHHTSNDLLSVANCVEVLEGLASLSLDCFSPGMELLKVFLVWYSHL